MGTDGKRVKSALCLVLCALCAALNAAPTIISPVTDEANPVQLFSTEQYDYLYNMTQSERSSVLKNRKMETAVFCSGSPLTLSWKNSSGTCTVTVKRLSDGSEFWTGTTSGMSVSVVNLEVGAGYTWTVKDSSGSAEATFYTRPEPPRLIKSGEMKMMRDLGGWQGLDGCRIRQNQIFRGGPANNGTPDDAARTFFYDNVGLKTEIDFRSKSEAGSNPAFDNEGDHVTYRLLPIDFNKIYTSGTSGNGANFAESLKLIMNVKQPGRPAYFHCRVGRDRTGTMAAVLLAVLGVSEDDIVRDYQASAYKGEDYYDSSTMNDGFKSFLANLAKYKSSSLSLAENAAAYCKALGITGEQVETFRKEMLIGYGEEAPAAPSMPTDLSPNKTAADPIALLSSAQRTYLYDKTYIERDKVSSSSVSFTGGSPVTLSWKGTYGTCTVSVKRLSDGKTIWTGTTSGTSVSVVNLEIGAGYAWTVTDSSKNTASATFYTSAEPPRLIKTGDMVVMRDLGGWTGTLGGKEYKVRQNQLIRGGPAANADGNDDAVTFFRDIVGLKTELDLRGTSSDRLNVTGVAYVPLSRDSNYCVKKEDMDKKGKDFWPNLIETFKVIFDARQRPAYFHCSLGKDRTGITACLALGLLGVSEEDIWRDWQATAVGARVIDSSGTDGSYMAGYIHDMKEHAGKSNLNEAIELYFRDDLGFTKEQIETFRTDMLIGYGEPPEPPKPTYHVEEPVYVTATRVTFASGKSTGTQYTGFLTKKGCEYAWGTNGVAETEWELGDGTPMELKKPDEVQPWELMVR